MHREVLLSAMKMGERPADTRITASRTETSFLLTPPLKKKEREEVTNIGLVSEGRGGKGAVFSYCAVGELLWSPRPGIERGAQACAECPHRIRGEGSGGSKRKSILCGEQAARVSRRQNWPRATRKNSRKNSAPEGRALSKDPRTLKGAERWHRRGTTKASNTAPEEGRSLLAGRGKNLPTT